jgi:VanZ family protein
MRRARLVAVAWGLFLLALTSWPSPPEAPAALSWIPDLDKLIHATLYGVEGFLVYRAIRWKGSPRFAWNRVLRVACLMAVWGALDEVHQIWIPGRSAEVADALTDTVAGFAGAAAASLWSGIGRAGATSPRS